MHDKKLINMFTHSVTKWDYIEKEYTPDECLQKHATTKNIAGRYWAKCMRAAANVANMYLKLDWI